MLNNEFPAASDGQHQMTTGTMLLCELLNNLNKKLKELIHFGKVTKCIHVTHLEECKNTLETSHNLPSHL
jgi:hypothetical protein